MGLDSNVQEMLVCSIVGLLLCLVLYLKYRDNWILANAFVGVFLGFAVNLILFGMLKVEVGPHEEVVYGAVYLGGVLFALGTKKFRE